MPKITIESDEPVVVLPLSVYEDILERIEILSIPNLREDIELAEKEFREGKTTSWEDLKKELGINDD